jgi:hypothetical protein
MIDLMKRKPFSDQIRDAVNASGMSRYRICMEVKLNQPTMSRFMAGKAGLSMRVLDRLADFLALEVVMWPKPKDLPPEGFSLRHMHPEEFVGMRPLSEIQCDYREAIARYSKLFRLNQEDADVKQELTELDNVLDRLANELRAVCNLRSHYSL